MAETSGYQNLVSIESVTVTAKYSGEFHLETLASKAWNTEFKVGGRAIVRGFKEPSGSAIIFRSGKVNFFGHKTEEDVRTNSRKLKRMLKVCGYKTVIEDFKVTQVVGTARFEGGIDFYIS